ncbi:lysozyme inhibitor LprI family protein [Brenneria goodwinii]|uniref:lysozyme inhibitor LprI family protein n=1 Tax=Brenneria goodwinii TaxID=1109412 RepID=UPI0036E85C85
MNKKMFFFVTTLLYQGPVFAENVCVSPASDADLLNCTVKEKEEAEKIINQEYIAAKKRISSAYEVSPKLSQDYMKTLLDSQRAWLKYRDSQCKLEVYLAEEGTSANKMLISKCIARLDKERVGQLQAMPYQ